MSSVRGMVAGVLGLSLLEAVVSSSQATANATGVIGFVSRGMARWLDPTTPLIPDLRAASVSVNVPGIPFSITGSSAKVPTTVGAPVITAVANSTPLPVGANVGAGTTANV